MEDDDDLYTKLYGEAAPKAAPVTHFQELKAEAEAEPNIAPHPDAAEPIVAPSAESSRAFQADTFNLDEAEAKGVSTFDDDEDDFEIRLDKIEPPDPEDEDDLDIRLDEKKDSAPSGLPPTPPGIASVHKYVRAGAPQAAPGKPLTAPAVAQVPGDSNQPGQAAAPPPGLQPLKRPPSYPTYDPNDPGVLPSQATAKGQRVRLPGQTRVTPEEYKEFLCLGHGDIFNLDIDCVVDAPWYQPGADPADFFNYGLNPRTWKEHCAAVQKFQTEFTMQRQIEVYDRDGRARNQSDMPPELAAAVAQRRAAEGPPKPPHYQDRAGNGHAGFQNQGGGQRALPYSKWHGRDGSQGGSEPASKPRSDGGLPLPPFAALEWNMSSEKQGNQQGESQLLASKRRKLDAG